MKKYHKKTSLHSAISLLQNSIEVLQSKKRNIALRHESSPKCPIIAKITLLTEAIHEISSANFKIDPNAKLCAILEIRSAPIPRRKAQKLIKKIAQIPINHY